MLAGIDWFLAYFSFLSLIAIIALIFSAAVMYITYLIFKASKQRKETPKVLSAVIRRLNPIKAKAEKFCIKINYKD